MTEFQAGMTTEQGKVVPACKINPAIYGKNKRQKQPYCNKMPGVPGVLLLA